MSGSRNLSAYDEGEQKGGKRVKGAKSSKYIKAIQNKKGWGIENLPFPKGLALIEARWDLCIGCGFCEVACSMFHYGIINRELSRIRVYRYLLPAPKSVQNVCCQCSDQERECQKACPLDPPVTLRNSIWWWMKRDAWA
jgi:ferredoxin